MHRLSIVMLAWFGVGTAASGQNINWRVLGAGPASTISVNAGLDYGVAFGVAYGHRVSTRVPIVVGADYSFPAGDRLTDDFKVRSGLQMEVMHAGGFSATVKANGVFRRFENTQAVLQNFGSEFAGIAGYYTRRWFVAGEVTFDKAIITHVRHLKVATDLNPGLVTGWYIPTGGNLLFGVQTGVTLGRTDVTFKVGQAVTQDLSTKPLIPFYTQLSYGIRF
jgi:hypothetical protein